MKKSSLALASILVAGASCFVADDTREPGSIRTESASLTRDSGEVIEYELGTLFVPENRAKESSRIIGVGFARFKALEPTTTPPIFLLPGGPGGSYVSLLDDDNKSRLARLLEGLDRYRRIADVVLVDQRGASSRGEMLEAEVTIPGPITDRPYSLEREIERFTELAHDVVDQFKETEVDLSGYTVVECAHDVNDLRQALGYDEITLNGTSFGSQWSFTVMRLHSEIVARALLSGVEPIDHGYDMPSYVFAALQRIWESVERDERFAPYLPEGGLAEATRVVKKRLEREPLELTAKETDGGKRVVGVLGADHVFVWDPVEILELYHRHYERLNNEAAFASLTPPEGVVRQMPLLGPLIDSSLGVTPMRRRLLWNDPATRYLGRSNFALYLAVADILPSPDVGDELRTPIVSEIPVVFAQGDWDTSTPIENTYEIAPFFPNSRVLIAERGGHGVLGPIASQKPDVWETLEEFLRSGDFSRVPTRIRLEPSRAYDPPDFPLPDSGSGPGKDAE